MRRRARATNLACASVREDTPTVRQDGAVSPPVLVVVTGMPSSGKTTVAEALSRRLRLPLIAKDEI